MNDFQREYFRRKLENWKDELLHESDLALQSLKEEKEICTDIADRASTETALGYELRSKERARKLISKIDDALAKIKDGTYGYCEDTGEPIDLRRLEARPTATLSIQAQERHEKMEKTQKDD
ncbi:MAG: RNA polymerase-binding protein DksA [Alphaproteobacteria bacterium]|nr:RNA polymerase-binding protein DksA [Alphaproteobacteria bacterium]MCR4623960.1 RNA polymerase-binding protein DksA [Alphaproteobacteria bacterium]